MVKRGVDHAEASRATRESGQSNRDESVEDRLRRLNEVYHWDRLLQCELMPSSPTDVERLSGTRGLSALESVTKRSGRRRRLLGISRGDARTIGRKNLQLSAWPSYNTEVNGTVDGNDGTSCTIRGPECSLGPAGEGATAGADQKSPPPGTANTDQGSRQDFNPPASPLRWARTDPSAETSSLDGGGGGLPDGGGEGVASAERFGGAERLVDVRRRLRTTAEGSDGEEMPLAFDNALGSVGGTGSVDDGETPKRVTTHGDSSDSDGGVSGSTAQLGGPSDHRESLDARSDADSGVDHGPQSNDGSGFAGFAEGEGGVRNSGRSVAAGSRSRDADADVRGAELGSDEVETGIVALVRPKRTRTNHADASGGGSYAEEEEERACEVSGDEPYASGRDYCSGEEIGEGGIFRLDRVADETGEGNDANGDYAGSSAFDADSFECGENGVGGAYGKGGRFDSDGSSTPIIHRGKPAGGGGCKPHLPRRRKKRVILDDDSDEGGDTVGASDNRSDRYQDPQERAVTREPAADNRVAASGNEKSRGRRIRVASDGDSDDDSAADTTAVRGAEQPGVLHRNVAPGTAAPGCGEKIAVDAATRSVRRPGGGVEKSKPRCVRRAEVPLTGESSDETTASAGGEVHEPAVSSAECGRERATGESEPGDGGEPPPGVSAASDKASMAGRVLANRHTESRGGFSGENDDAAWGCESSDGGYYSSATVENGSGSETVGGHSKAVATADVDTIAAAADASGTPAGASPLDPCFGSERDGEDVGVAARGRRGRGGGRGGGGGSTCRIRTAVIRKRRVVVESSSSSSGEDDQERERERGPCRRKGAAAAAASAAAATTAANHEHGGARSESSCFPRKGSTVAAATTAAAVLDVDDHDDAEFTGAGLVGGGSDAAVSDEEDIADETLCPSSGSKKAVLPVATRAAASPTPTTGTPPFRRRRSRHRTRRVIFDEDSDDDDDSGRDFEGRTGASPSSVVGGVAVIAGRERGGFAEVLTDEAPSAVAPGLGRDASFGSSLGDEEWLSAESDDADAMRAAPPAAGGGTGILRTNRVADNNSELSESSIADGEQASGTRGGGRGEADADGDDNVDDDDDDWLPLAQSKTSARRGVDLEDSSVAGSSSEDEPEGRHAWRRGHDSLATPAAAGRRRAGIGEETSPATPVSNGEQRVVLVARGDGGKRDARRLAPSPGVPSGRAGRFDDGEEGATVVPRPSIVPRAGKAAAAAAAVVVTDVFHTPGPNGARGGKAGRRTVVSRGRCVSPPTPEAANSTRRTRGRPLLTGSAGGNSSSCTGHDGDHHHPVASRAEELRGSAFFKARERLALRLKESC